MNIIAFIPARGQSKSIHKKNVGLLGEKPLLVWSIEVAQKCGLRTIVNTEDLEIKQIANQYGAEVIDRPITLAQDNTSMYELLKKEVPKIKPLPDLVLLLQPTCPFRKSVHIKTAISYLTENIDKYNSLISVERVPEKYNPYAIILENKRMIFRKLTGIKEKFLSLFTGKKYKESLSGYPISQRITRRQDFPQAWIPDGAIYLFKPENLKKGSIYGKNVMLLENEGTLNINTEEDFKKAEQMVYDKIS